MITNLKTFQSKSQNKRRQTERRKLVPGNLENLKKETILPNKKADYRRRVMLFSTKAV